MKVFAAVDPVPKQSCGVGNARVLSEILAVGGGVPKSFRDIRMNNIKFVEKEENYSKSKKSDGSKSKKKKIIIIKDRELRPGPGLGRQRMKV
ncbi:hypothetical protein RRF57_007598 [Xylaria bambusicola]|uniref:Uncharacterized protein n=1 Tax=Xylaria bambusicola TaxID=326684 RepID=A0AAN7UQR1_9PEZI